MNGRRSFNARQHKQVGDDRVEPLYLSQHDLRESHGLAVEYTVFLPYGCFLPAVC